MRDCIGAIQGLYGGLHPFTRCNQPKRCNPAYVRGCGLHRKVAKFCTLDVLPWSRHIPTLPMKCLDCGSDTTEYVYEVSCEICTICGTLVQSSGDTLADFSESQTYDEGRAMVNESVFTGEGTKGHSGRVQAVSEAP